MSYSIGGNFRPTLRKSQVWSSHGRPSGLYALRRQMDYDKAIRQRRENQEAWDEAVRAVISRRRPERKYER